MQLCITLLLSSSLSQLTTIEYMRVNSSGEPTAMGGATVILVVSPSWPPECNSISTTEVAVIDITENGFNGVKLVRETSIPLYMPKSSTMVSETLIQVSGGHFIDEMVKLRAAFAATSAHSLPRIPT